MMFVTKTFETFWHSVWSFDFSVILIIFFVLMTSTTYVDIMFIFAKS